MESTSRSVRDGIAAALSQTVGKRIEISDDTNIARDLGLDSLAIMNFIMALEDEYDISIPLDRVAQAGLRYTEFNSTALCSPSRAALITGHNHHAVGFGVIAELRRGIQATI